MADGENAAPASKKRVAGVQLSKDNPEVDDDTSETEMGTFQRASEEVMATRRIVKNDTGSEANGTESGALLNEKEGKEENSGQSEDTTNEVTSKGDSTRLAEGGEVENGAKETVDEAEEEAGEETKAERTELEKTEAEKREAEEEKKDEEEKKEDEEGTKVDEDEKKDNQEEKKESEQKEKSASATPFSSFKEMSSSQMPSLALRELDFRHLHSPLDQFPVKDRHLRVLDLSLAFRKIMHLLFLLVQVL
uniref:Nuclear pore complex NUP2/50/61 domain-containing protein n=1 Tax=Ananas comosus var. bracteatus TaxID=296719 RepID=A0A6V7PE99_ANACO|nr:unnamed protein product [Ananas comosus var. bracteatus]